MRTIFLASMAAVLLVPASTFSASLKPWVGLNGSWGTYSMSDINDKVRDINSAIAGSGLSMKEIDNGFGLGGIAGVDLSTGATFGLGYDHLFARTELGDATGTLTFDFPANAFRAIGEYKFRSASRFSPRLGVAGGLVSEAGSIDLSVTGGPSEKEDITGSGPLFEAYAGGELWAAPQFAVTGSLGYRYAKVKEVKASGETIVNSDRSKSSVDYGGVLARLGLKFAFVP